MQTISRWTWSNRVLCWSRTVSHPLTVLSIATAPGRGLIAYAPPDVNTNTVNGSLRNVVSYSRHLQGVRLWENILLYVGD